MMMIVASTYKNKNIAKNQDDTMQLATTLRHINKFLKTQENNSTKQQKDTIISIAKQRKQIEQCMNIISTYNNKITQEIYVAYSRTFMKYRQFSRRNDESAKI